jgi:hypothetical protein
MLGMMIYSFQSHYWNIKALTLDASGATLPPAYAPWDLHEAGGSSEAEGLADPVIRELRQSGLFVTTGRTARRQRRDGLPTVSET